MEDGLQNLISIESILHTWARKFERRD
jgi:hypothetical protein